MSMTTIEFNHPLFSVHRYDRDGDRYETGIYLEYGDVSIKIAKNIEGFKAHAECLLNMIPELEDNLK